jgi:alpha-methylacyl-CoA racemase
MKLLEGIKILDISTRLPGPLAGKILSDLGAEVIKVEDKNKRDPFAMPLGNTKDLTFNRWYKNINQDKNIIFFDYKSPKDQSEIKKLIQRVDGVILSLPPNLQDILGLSQNEIEKSDQQIAVVSLSAQKESENAMHDLNALAETQILNIYTNKIDKKIINPPFLPIAGITYGNKIATDLIAAILKTKKNNSPLYYHSDLLSSTQEILGTLFKGQTESSFLHNGKYPCYSIYQTKDKNFIALAAIEEKYWNEFSNCFGLHLTPEDRFNYSEKIFNIISNKISSYTQDEIVVKTKSSNFCLSIIYDK